MVTRGYYPTSPYHIVYTTLLPWFFVIVHYLPYIYIIPGMCLPWVFSANALGSAPPPPRSSSRLFSRILHTILNPSFINTANYVLSLQFRQGFCLSVCLNAKKKQEKKTFKITAVNCIEYNMGNK